MSGPRIGGLFEGYGGLTRGVQAALGGELAWYSEIDKGALKILTHRFPDVPNIGDITTVDWSQVEPVDILTGGSPCQDLSHAGKRAGMTEGTRSNLWVAMREAIAQLRPGLVIWENVRGAYSAEADSDLVTDPRLLADTRRRDGQPVLRALGRVLGDLSDLGYMGGWHGLRAADIGAPHGRFRVFVTAYNDVAFNATVSGLQGPTSRRIQHGLSGAGRGGSADLTLLPTPQASEAAKAVSGQSVAHREAGGHQVWLTNVVHDLALLPTPRVKNNENRQSEGYGGEDGNFYGLLHDERRWGDYAAAIARWETVLGRPAPAPTMTSTKGNQQLSPAFVEWLMGLPAGWVTDVPGITRNEALKALGNGVVPQQAEAAVRFLLAHIESEAAA